jgi:formiminoglutamase
MFDIFQNTTRPNEDLFFNKNDANDVRLGETVSSEAEDYQQAEIVILGCPQDEGVARNSGRIGAALAPEAIRRQFYKLTPFGIAAKVFDAGDTIIQNTLEETHDLHTKIVEQILRDSKIIIVIGGGNDISYADGCAMANVHGAKNWLAFNIDAHFDVRADSPRNSGTPYRQILDERLLEPVNFYEIGYQQQAASPVYFDYLKKLGVNLMSIEGFQNSENNFQNLFFNEISFFQSSLSIFWGFDLDAVCAADAPGVSAPSPIGLTAKEFCSLAKLAGKSLNTKIIEFTELNPNYDIDNRTAKLAAIAMHEFIRATKSKTADESAVR